MSRIDRLASRLRPSGALSALEEPRTIVWIGVIWTWGSALNTFLIATFFFSYGEALSGWIAVGLAMTYLLCWVILATTGSIRATFGVAITASMVAVPIFQLTMGGYAYSGAQAVWAIGVTVVAALLLSRRAAIVVASYWLVAVVAFGFAEQSLQASRTPPDPELPAIFFAYNVVAHLVLLVPVVIYLLEKLRSERARSESLLLNVLPESIARRLKGSQQTIAEHFDECSILFADIAGFTAHSKQVSAVRLVDELNTVFSAFDELAGRSGVLKIKTTGDGYMAVAGVPDPHPDPIRAACDLALAMQTAIGHIADDLEADLQLRIGIHSGPVVAGIIGTSRFSYDLWGETVNMASRLESQGQPGRIQVSERIAETVSDSHAFESSGVVDLRGIGPVPVYWLVGRRGAEA